MKKLVLAVVATLGLLCGLWTPTASAQAVYGSIIGTVTDPSGAAVANVKVTVTSQTKNISVEATTNESGNYAVTHLIPDVYSVRVEGQGFKVLQFKDIIVNADSAANVDGQFQVGSTSEQVEVTAEAPQLKTDRSDVAVEFNSKYVEDLPILNRNFTSFELLSPGTQKLSWGHAATENPQGSQQIFVQGQHFSGTAYELDGTDNQDPILGIIVVNPNLDAVTETKVALQNYDAEFGKAVAGVVTAQTKSGSNEIHGSAFWFRRSDANQARDPFTQFQRDKITGRFIPRARWQQFGGSIGGPVIKNKLFFFGDYQGTRQTSGITNQLAIPTALAQSTCNPATNASSSSPGFCNLSEYLGTGGNGVIYDPNTGTPGVGNGGPRVQFCGPAGCAAEPNWIPMNAAAALSVGHPATSVVSPQAGAIMALFPTPSTPGISNNFLGSGSGPFSQNSFDTRIDFAASSTLNVFGRFSLDYFSLSGKGVLGPLGGPGSGLLGLSGSSITHNYSLATGFTKTLSASLLTDFRFGWFKYNPQTKKADGGTPMTAFGIPNANTSDPKTAGLGEFLLGADPSVGEGGAPNNGGTEAISSFGDGLGVGRCNCPLTEKEDQFQFVNNWTKTKGNHIFKFGADVRYARNLRIPSDNNRTGEYNFSPQETSNQTLPANVPTGGLDLASFLLGDVSSLSRYVTNPALTTINNAAERQKRLFFYGQDTYRVTSKLTVNYGLRWEIYTPESVLAKDYGGFANIVDNNGTGVIRVAGEGYGLNGNVKNSLHAFAPRLGIAYQLTPKTVVRMGYGRSYDIGVFGSNFGHTVTQNLPVLIKQNIDAGSLTAGAATGNDIPAFTLAQGPVAPVFPAIPSNGQITFASLGGQDSGVHIRPIKQVLPTLDAWNLTVQRQVTNTISAEIAYVGNKGSHGFSGDGPNYDVNPLSMFLYGTKANSSLRRPLCDPAFTVAPGTPGVTPLGSCTRLPDSLGNYYGNDASSSYNALEMKVDKRFNQGLQFIAHYTYARANAYNNNYYAISHPVAYGPNDFVRNHVFVVNTVYELPFGKGKAFLSNSGRVMNYLVGGYQLTNTTNWSGGLPWTPSTSECGSEEDVGICRPNKGPGSFHTGVGSLNSVTHQIVYFTPLADPSGNSLLVSGPSSGFALPGVGTLGNIGYNSFRGPRGFYSDLSVTKNIPIGERVKAQFRMDAFNVFNHPVYAFSGNNGANPCVDCGNSDPTKTNGKITDIEGGTSMRALQFALRLNF